ncbi:MAG: undecaprenyl-diphosphate phosphatase [Puniceicoccales bacterium]|jgi:undecaprenyl-diphosphatase|nr:undecaprenyl-diphosphate phosphatase [Puniceicoccales bacterium]
MAICILSISCANASGGDIFTAGEAVALGITQGATEFLPISSTGHLILVDKFLLNHRLEEFGDGEDVAASALRARGKSSYFCIIQCGSILAVLLLYRNRFLQMALSVLGKDCRGRKLAINLIVSFLPAALVGLAADGWIQKKLYGEIAISMALLIGSAIMLLAEMAHNKKSEANFVSIEDLTARKSFAIGCWQCLALIPGMSRSMATIVGGYGCGLRRSDAVEYSFLLGALTLAATVMYKCARDFDAIFLCLGAGTFFMGIAIAFAVSAATIKIFTAFVARHGTYVFAAYRIVLAIAILCNALA